MLIVLLIILVFSFINYFLGYKLYREPENKAYFNNVKNINTIKTPEIAPDPQYILLITLLCGMAIGCFIALVNKMGEKSIYSYIFIILVSTFYLIEISRRIKVSEDSLILSKMFSKTKTFPLNEITGIYIYSLSKKFMKKHVFTTKLVVVTKDKKIRYTISSLNKNAILNVIKNNFGVTDYKIFVASSK